MKAGRRPDRLSTDVEAVIEPRNHVSKADGIDVEHRRRVGIVADHARLAGHRDEVADPHRVRAEQIRLHAEQVAIAAGELQHGFDPRLLLDEHRERQRAHAGAARSVGDVHDVDAANLQRARLLDHLIADEPLRRQQLDDGRKAAGGKRRRELGFLAARDRRRSRRRRIWRVHKDPPRATGCGGLRRQFADIHLPDRRFHLPDVLRRRAAAAADQTHALLREAARIRGEIFRRGQVDVPPLDVARPARVRLRREPRPRHRRHPLDGLEHVRRPDAAVDADHIRAAPLHLRRELLRRRSVEAVAVVLDRHLRDDRQLRDAAHRGNRGADLVQIAEGLQNEEVDAPFDERLRLLPEVRFGLVGAHLAPRLDAHAEWPHGARHVRLIARGLLRDARAFDIDLAHLVAQTERPQLDAVGAERVGLEHVGAGADVVLMDLRHRVGRHDVQRVEAAVDEHALRVEHRPHRAVADEHAFIESREKRFH